MTAGPDEKQMLHVVPAPVPDPAAPDDDERALKERLMKITSGPPPMPTYAPSVPAPQPPADAAPDEDADKTDWWNRRGRPWYRKPERETEGAAGGQEPPRALNDRLPPWNKPKPLLENLNPAGDGQEGAPEETPELEKTPAELSVRDRLRDWVSRNVQQQGDAEPGGADVEAAPAGTRRWSRPSIGRPAGIPEPKQNVFTWWGGVEQSTKWLMWHATGVAGGVYIGLFDQALAGAEFVKTHPQDDINVWATYGMAGIVFALDYITRHRFFLLAWLTRAATTTVIVGVLWHGTPLADLTR